MIDYDIDLLETVRDIRWGAVEIERQEDFLKAYLYILKEFFF